MSYCTCRTFFPSLLSLAGLDGRKCYVVPQDLFVEVGSSVEVMCQSWCFHGKIYWTLNKRILDESLSKTINSSHSVLSLAHITEPVTTLQCHSSAIQQILGGTTITTYSKKYFWYFFCCFRWLQLSILCCFYSKAYQVVMHVASDNKRSTRTVNLQLGASE